MLERQLVEGVNNFLYGVTSLIPIENKYRFGFKKRQPQFGWMALFCGIAPSSLDYQELSSNTTTRNKKFDHNNNNKNSWTRSMQREMLTYNTGITQINNRYTNRIMETSIQREKKHDTTSTSNSCKERTTTSS